MPVRSRINITRRRHREQNRIRMAVRRPDRHIPTNIKMEEQSSEMPPAASPSVEDPTVTVIKKEKDEAETITGDLPAEEVVEETKTPIIPVTIKQEMTFECDEPDPEPPVKKRRGRKPGSTKKTPEAATAAAPARRSSRRAATKASYVESLDLEIEEEVTLENEEHPEQDTSTMDDTMDATMDASFEDYDDGELVGEDEELGPVSEFSDVEEDDDDGDDELKPKEYTKEEMAKMTPLEVFKHVQTMRQYRLARKINHLKYKEQLRKGQIDQSQPRPKPSFPPPPPEDPAELKRREDSKLRQGLRDAIKVGRMCAELVEAMLDDKGENRDQVTCKRILEDLANKPISPRAILYYPRVVGVVRKCLGPPANPDVQEVASHTLKSLQNLFGIEFDYFEEMFGSMDDLDVLSQTLIKKEV